MGRYLANCCLRQLYGNISVSGAKSLFYPGIRVQDISSLLPTVLCQHTEIDAVVPPPLLLYSLFTHDCVAKHTSNSIIKFADDTTVVGLITNNDESAYRENVRALGV